MRRTGLPGPCGLALLVLVCPLVARAGPVLIGGTLDGIIYDVDPVTGQATNPRDTGLEYLTGLAFSPEGVLYGLGVDAETETGLLFSIDRETGSPLLVGPTGTPWGRDLEFDVTTASLYFASTRLGAPSSALYRLDPISLVPEPVGLVPGTIVSVAVNTSGELYTLSARGPAPAVLRHVDKTNAAVLETFSLEAILSETGTSISPDGSLYVVDTGRYAPASLYRFDLVTNELAVVGALDPNGTVHLQSLAYVPEPNSAVLLALVISALVARQYPNRRMLRGGVAAMVLLDVARLLAQEGGAVSTGAPEETGLGSLALHTAASGGPGGTAREVGAVPRPGLTAPLARAIVPLASV